MVTGATLHKEHFFKTDEELSLLQNALHALAIHYHWRLEAWAVFSNHYHFIAQSPDDPKTLRKFISHFHANTTRELNLIHRMPGRQVWYQYWDSHITFQNSYLARLNYVMQNPVRHKLVTCATAYKWCSAHWFEKNAGKAHFAAVTRFKTDSISVVDEF